MYLLELNYIANLLIYKLKTTIIINEDQNLQ